jgi:DNA-binding CsgD family transcriptional regulator
MRQIPLTTVEEQLWQILDVFPLAVVLLGRDRQVKGMNLPAESLLQEADAIRLEGRALRAVDPGIDAQLQAVVAERKHPFVGRIPRTRSRPLEICSLPPHGDDFALVFADPARRIVPSCHGLRALYGLTPRESRVVVSLMSDFPAVDAAAELGMSVNTLRRHIKNIFVKLRVRRQSQLVRVVASGISTLVSVSHDPNE